ncbi:MAG: hypothetical protein R6U32_06910 [Candidatus Woesearchaeota archaeon]
MRKPYAKNYVIPAVLALAVLILAGCASDISEVKSPENEGETVVVKGTVKNTIKLGKISGFTLDDGTGEIGVSSEEMPSEGSEARVKGTLMNNTLLGYYIKADKVS